MSQGLGVRRKTGAVYGLNVYAQLLSYVWILALNSQTRVLIWSVCKYQKLGKESLKGKGKTGLKGQYDSMYCEREYRRP